jgi:cell surface protein SprA
MLPILNVISIITTLKLELIFLISHTEVNGKLLVQVMGLDKLSVNGDPYSDGVFDFIKDYTINPNNGRIYLSTKEPFGII